MACRGSCLRRQLREVAVADVGGRDTVLALAKHVGQREIPVVQHRCDEHEQQLGEMRGGTESLYFCSF